MAPKRVVYFVITIAALWLMGSPPASMAQPGIERIVWMGGVALVWVLVMFFLLVRATVASLDRNLQPNLTMAPVAEERMPDALRAAADRFAALGFTRATPPLAVALSHPGLLLGFVQEGGDVAGSAFCVERPASLPALTSFDVFSRFEGDRGGLTTSPSRSAAVLHPTPGALRQVFPGADAATLLARHREALAWLSTQGIRARPLRGVEFETLFRSAMERHRAAFVAARLRFAFTAIWRVVSRSTPNLGPLPQQRTARTEIRRLARP